MTRKSTSSAWLVLAGVLCLSSLPSANAVEDAGDPTLRLLVPPVDALVERRFEEPSSRFGPGHRGIDYAVAAGTRVRAAGAGIVSWAGPVAGNLAVTINHGSGLETTYSILADVEVARGEAVDEGRFIGSVGRDHAGDAGGLHFGVKLDDAYVDPMSFLGPVDLGDAIHLAPLVEEEPGIPHELRLAHEGAGAAVRPCRDPASIASPPPPNDNVAVAIGGLSSSTLGGTNAAILEPANGPRSLGYPPGRVYRFSYRGTRGPRLHEPYEVADTWRDIRSSALRLRRLLREIAKAHPGAEVDLFAHSQGGLVARAALAHLTRAFDPRLPRVAHLITYGTPHLGATLAEVPEEMRRGTLSGRFLTDLLSDRAEEGRFPLDPEATSVDQMRPDSSFITGLAQEDVSFGTRVLALATPHDLIVPARHALWSGEDSRVMSPGDINGHREVVVSAQARALAYAFVRDAPASCLGNWDEWGPMLGSAVALGHGLIADAYAELELMGLAKALRAVKWLGDGGLGVLRWAGSQARRAATWLGDRAEGAGRGLLRAGSWIADRATAAGRFVRSGLARGWRPPEQ
ncbi:MAG: peptidoglycan DD-metalloendopeptidase family protein [Actinomycetota bacterium]|nr:peptidoglycan DD-metalloendopeptidase family protein [Actinomycetota bacterium]